MDYFELSENINDHADEDYDEDDFDDDDDDEDEGISFEKYAELSAKIDSAGKNREMLNSILEQEGYSKEDWDFYSKVWMVEMADPEKLRQFTEIYSKYYKE